jgi:hypothetical protein
MKQKINLIFCLLLILAVSLGCLNAGQTLRDYSEKKFNSKEWLAGDEIERGRMIFDIFDRQDSFRNKTKEEILKIFGEPDKKVTVENREVWLYRTANRFRSARNLLPVTFDKKEGTLIGGIKNGTFSMVVSDDWVKE